MRISDVMIAEKHEMMLKREKNLQFKLSESSNTHY